MQLRIMTEPQVGFTYEQVLAAARATEQAGFDAFFRSDHYGNFGPGDGGPGSTDAWVTLAGVARETSRVRLGTLVSPVTFRHPGVLAITVAQVDAMSDGRVELGLGTGWNAAEHQAFGIPFPPLGERFERLEEALDVVTGLWAVPEGRTWNRPGRFWPVDGATGKPKPLQRPRPPIIIGGAGRRRTPRLAAAHADEYNLPLGNPDTFPAQRERVARACERAGRDPATMTWSVMAPTVCGADATELEQRAATIRQPVDRLRQFAVAGTPDEVVERLGEYAEAGIDRVYLQLLDLSDVDHIGLLGSEVRPRVEVP